MKNSNRIIRFLSLAVIASAAPLAMSSAQEGLKVNEACAATLDGSCCPAAAICGLNGENFAGYEYHAGSCF